MVWAATEPQEPAVAVETAETPDSSVGELPPPRSAPRAVTVETPVPGEEKQDIIAQFQVKAGDTGSPEVQVALLTKRIEKLVAHLRSNPQDNHSRRGLLGIVSKRRRLLNYLEKKDTKRYAQVSGKLGLGK